MSLVNFIEIITEGIKFAHFMCDLQSFQIKDKCETILSIYSVFWCNLTTYVCTTTVVSIINYRY